jgi:transcriptional regulator GlxA family with amidase domain
VPTASSANQKPFRVGLVLFPGCMPAGLFAAADMVRASNLRAGSERMQVTWVAVERADVPIQGGPSLRAEASFGEAGCDALLLPGLWLSSTDALDAALRVQQPLVEALRKTGPAFELWSYCAGVALAAASGRLDRKEATATWWLQPALATRFPRVRWQVSSDLARSHSTVTASGPNGYLPLMLDQLARHYPSDVLDDVQEVLMLPRPRARHAAFQAVEMIRVTHPSLRTLLAWTRGTPAQEVSLIAAAGQLNVSVRTLCRRVAGETGIAAGEWLRLAKLGQAAEALRSSRAPVKTIADDLGFGSEGSLYRAFKAVTDLTPSDYRQAYGALPAAMARKPLD